MNLISFDKKSIVKLNSDTINDLNSVACVSKIKDMVFHFQTKVSLVPFIFQVSGAKKVK